MKLLKLTILGLALTSAGSFASSYEDGRLSTDVEYVYRYAGNSKGEKCKDFVGPRLLEAFKGSGDEAKVAEFSDLDKLMLCGSGNRFTFESEDRVVAENNSGYRVSDVMFRVEVKDENERRIDDRRSLSPDVSTRCGTRKQTLSKLRGSVTKDQFDDGDSLVITIRKGKWKSCR